MFNGVKVDNFENGFKFLKEIVNLNHVFDGNFHGRTLSIISFSSDPLARDHFGPYTPGFRTVPFGNIAADQHFRAFINGVGQLLLYLNTLALGMQRSHTDFWLFGFDQTIPQLISFYFINQRV